MLCPQCGKEEFRGCGNHGWAEGEGLLCTECGWQKKPYVPRPEKQVWHPRDIADFEEFPSDIMSNMQRLHHCNVNSTIPFFGPMMYFLVRQFGCGQVLEIGHAEGYTSFYLAQAVKDNAKRYNYDHYRYYGIDIVQTETVREKLLSNNLPVILEHKDSMTLTKDSFPGVDFELIFQDGNHDKEHIMHEFEAMWPRLRGMGNGYWLAHDVYGPGDEGCQAIIDKIYNENIPVEFIRLSGMYGLLIIRKMEGYDPKLWKWEDFKHKDTMRPQFTMEEVNKNEV